MCSLIHVVYISGYLQEAKINLPSIILNFWQAKITLYWPVALFLKVVLLGNNFLSHILCSLLELKLFKRTQCLDSGCCNLSLTFLGNYVMVAITRDHWACRIFTFSNIGNAYNPSLIMSMLSLIMFDAGAVFQVTFLRVRVLLKTQKNIHEILYAVQYIHIYTYIVSWHYSYPFCYLGIVKIMNDFLQKATL